MKTTAKYKELKLKRNNLQKLKQNWNTKKQVKMKLKIFPTEYENSHVITQLFSYQCLYQALGRQLPSATPRCLPLPTFTSLSYDQTCLNRQAKIIAESRRLSRQVYSQHWAN